MNIRKIVAEFASVFAIALGTAVLVTFLWNLIGYGQSTIDWETSLLFAILFGITQTRVKWQEAKK
jgi:hypothetical protein